MLKDKVSKWQIMIAIVATVIGCFILEKNDGFFPLKKRAKDEPKESIVSFVPQNEYVLKLLDFRQKYISAKNDIQRSSIYKEMQKFIFSNPVLENWVAKIESIETNKGAKEGLFTKGVRIKLICLKKQGVYYHFVRLKIAFNEDSEFMEYFFNKQEGDQIVFTGKIINWQATLTDYYKQIGDEGSYIFNPTFGIELSEVKDYVQ